MHRGAKGWKRKAWGRFVQLANLAGGGKQASGTARRGAVARAEFETLVQSVCLCLTDLTAPGLRCCALHQTSVKRRSKAGQTLVSNYHQLPIILL